MLMDSCTNMPSFPWNKIQNIFCKADTDMSFERVSTPYFYMGI